MPQAWLTADLSRSGVVGDARGADAALGERLFEQLVAGWTRLFSDLLASAWPPVSSGSPWLQS